MKEFWTKVKNWLISLWERVKSWATQFWSWLNSPKVKPYAKHGGALLVIGLALLGTILFVRSRSDTKTESANSPEIAQVYEPSIGTPLAPDVVGRPGSVAGEVAPTPTPSPTPTFIPTPAPVAPVSGVNNLDEPYHAPKTGIDPNETIAYSNPDMRFKVTLPARTVVAEANEMVTFSAQNKSWFYTVTSARQGIENMSTIKAQLQNSPTVRTVQPVTFNGVDALQFTSTDFSGTGVGFIQNGKIYYLIGNSQYFQAFQII